uniref:Putative secreted protein n=1 Tax=Anopheles triannulatus TaxID=58253 RepID=A0A2M4B3K5_9DIPT
MLGFVLLHFARFAHIGAAIRRFPGPPLDAFPVTTTTMKMWPARTDQRFARYTVRGGRILPPTLAPLSLLIALWLLRRARNGELRHRVITITMRDVYLFFG